MAVTTAPQETKGKKSGGKASRTGGTNPPGRRARRNLPSLVLGALLVLGCGLASAGLYVNAGERTDVLAVRQEVVVGERIEESDLAQVAISVGSALRPIPVDRRSSVVGQVAKVGLVPGTLLLREQLVDRPVVPPGQSIVAVLLDFGQAPALEPGQEVVVIAPASDLSSSAQVHAVDQFGSSQGVRVSLLTDEATAVRIAEVDTTADKISLVLRSADP